MMLLREDNALDVSSLEKSRDYEAPFLIRGPMYEHFYYTNVQQSQKLSQFYMTAGYG